MNLAIQKQSIWKTDFGCATVAAMGGNPVGQETGDGRQETGVRSQESGVSDASRSAIRTPHFEVGTPVVHLLTHYVRWWANEVREFAGYRARFPHTITNPERMVRLCRRNRDHWIAKLRAERRTLHPSTHNS